MARPGLGEGAGGGGGGRLMANFVPAEQFRACQPARTTLEKCIRLPGTQVIYGAAIPTSPSIS